MDAHIYHPSRINIDECLTVVRTSRVLLTRWHRRKMRLSVFPFTILPISTPLKSPVTAVRGTSLRLIWSIAFYVLVLASQINIYCALRHDTLSDDY
jgi:hypothetical protein